MQKNTWGGARKGAGRPKGKKTRPNRVAVMFSDDEIAKLENMAAWKNLPLATMAYRLIAKGLI